MIKKMFQFNFNWSLLRLLIFQDAQVKYFRGINFEWKSGVVMSKVSSRESRQSNQKDFIDFGGHVQLRF